MKDFFCEKTGVPRLVCRPGRTSAISRWLSASDATGTEVVESDRSQRDRTLPGNDIVEATPKRRMSLESLRDSKIVDAINSGGVAPLSHRLIALMPPASGETSILRTPRRPKKNPSRRSQNGRNKPALEKFVVERPTSDKITGKSDASTDFFSRKRQSSRNAFMENALHRPRVGGSRDFQANSSREPLDCFVR